MVTSKIEALRKSFLFSRLEPKNLPKISQITQIKTFYKNELIFQEGDAAYGFFIVLRGRVKIYKLSYSGNEHILHMTGEGGSFAEAVVFDRLERYPAYAEAVSESQLLFIPKREFLDIMKNDFNLTRSVLASMSEKLKYFNALVEELSLKSADARVAKYLLDLAQKKKSDSFALDVKKVELAKRLGIAPETLSRIFKRFKLKRVVRFDGDQISSLNKEILQAISSGQKV